MMVEERMQLAGIRHVALSVRDLERSAAWYGEVLGFVELFREVRSAPPSS